MKLYVNECPRGKGGGSAAGVYSWLVRSEVRWMRRHFYYLIKPQNRDTCHPRCPSKWSQMESCCKYLQKRPAASSWELHWQLSPPAVFKDKVLLLFPSKPLYYLCVMKMHDIPEWSVTVKSGICLQYLCLHSCFAACNLLRRKWEVIKARKHKQEGLVPKNKNTPKACKYS